MKIGDIVKVIKINGNEQSDLLGLQGIVLENNKNNLYKYRVEIGEIVYGFQENEIELLESINSISVKDIATDIAALVEKKNHDYGNSFDKTIEEYGMTAYFLRIEDKLSRLKSLSMKKAKVDEAVEDTLIDIAGYTLLMLRNKLNK